MSRNIKNFHEPGDEHEQLKRIRGGQGDKAANVSGAARDTMRTEGARVIQTSGNGENETKADIRGRDAVVSWASCKSNYSRPSGGGWTCRDLWLVFATKDAPRCICSLRCFPRKRALLGARRVSIFHVYISVSSSSYLLSRFERRANTISQRVELSTSRVDVTWPKPPRTVLHTHKYFQWRRSFKPERNSFECFMSSSGDKEFREFEYMDEDEMH